jgi:hypothetical protein
MRRLNDGDRFSDGDDFCEDDGDGFYISQEIQFNNGISQLTPF